MISTKLITDIIDAGRCNGYLLQLLEGEFKFPSTRFNCNHHLEAQQWFLFDYK